MSARFWTLQIVGAALVLAAYLAGWLDGPFNGPARPACIILSVITIFALYLIATGRRKDARWLAHLMTAFGFTGSVLGLYGAAAGLTEANVWSVLGSAFIVWLSTAFGLIGWIWLEITLRLTRPRQLSNSEWLHQSLSERAWDVKP